VVPVIKMIGMISGWIPACARKDVRENVLL